MKTSLFEKLRQPTTIVLSAGHGAGDPGTVNGNFKEADEAIILVDEIAKQLKKRGITIDVVPHESSLKTAIKYVNARYDVNDAWAIEIHRSSADGLPVKASKMDCVAIFASLRRCLLVLSPSMHPSSSKWATGFVSRIHPNRLKLDSVSGRAQLVLSAPKRFKALAIKMPISVLP